MTGDIMYPDILTTPNYTVWYQVVPSQGLQLPIHVVKHDVLVYNNANNQSIRTDWTNYMKTNNMDGFGYNLNIHKLYDKTFMSSFCECMLANYLIDSSVTSVGCSYTYIVPNRYSWHSGYSLMLSVSIDTKGTALAFKVLPILPRIQLGVDIRVNANSAGVMRDLFNKSQRVAILHRNNDGYSERVDLSTTLLKHLSTHKADMPTLMNYIVLELYYALFNVQFSLKDIASGHGSTIALELFLHNGQYGKFYY